jgi:CBS domain-containing protein
MKEPAVNVMTDFKRVEAVTVDPNLLIDEALEKMIHTGVRLWFVTDDKEHLKGIITARDIMGEKPVRYIAKERVARDEIIVTYIMTPENEIEALSMDAVEKSCVGDVVETLRQAQRQHALVLDNDDHGRRVIRGIFSITQIGRQLGVNIPTTGLVQSFAELKALLTPGN